jgi:hypothetical protein
VEFTTRLAWLPSLADTKRKQLANKTKLQLHGASRSLEKKFYKGEVQVVNLPLSIVRHALTEHVEQQRVKVEALAIIETRILSAAKDPPNMKL